MVGRSVHQYTFLEKLGAGGMGEIYKAQDTRLNRFVAIKVLTSATSGDPERRRRFIQEAQAASALNHPNIITIHDIITDEGSQFLVMEYVQGKTFVELIPKGGMRVPQVLKYAVQMADALQVAHNAGIVHRDLKPGNVMATDSGLIKILDFGLAKLTDRGPISQISNANASDATMTIADAPLTVEGAIIGTVSYMSPEQAQGKKVDARSDVFSLGLVLYEMATGTRAFTGDSALSTLSAILRDEARSMAEIAPDVPPELEQVISKCLRKNPDDRWQSMKEVQQALTALKLESDSGILYRSRLGLATAPAPPSSMGVPPPMSAAPMSAPPPMFAPPPASMAPPPVSTLPSIPTPPPPSSVSAPPPPPVSQPSSMMPSAPQSQVRGPASMPPPPHIPAQAPPVQKATGGKKSAASMIVAAGLGAIVVLGGIGGGIWWWTHRTPAESPVPPPPVVATETPAPPAVEPPPPEPAPAAPPELPAAAKSGLPPAAKDKGVPPAAPPQAKDKGPVVAGKNPTPTPGNGKDKGVTPGTAEPPPVAAIPPPTATPQTPPPQVKSAPITATVTVPDGMPFVISLANDIPENADSGTPLKFVAKSEFRVGDTVVIAAGAPISGEIVDGARKRIIGSTKMTLKLNEAEAVGGQKIKIRALPSRGRDGNTDRPVETNRAKQKAKGTIASAGNEYIGYIDGQQVVTVHK